MITKFNLKDKTIKSYAIRKLTPFECFRLMGVRDDVIRTMQSTNDQAAERIANYKGKGKPEDMAVSASQQYKQAGNSIVVDVLTAVYQQLWYPKERKPEAQTSFFADFFPEDQLPTYPVDKNDGEKLILTTFSGYDSQLMAADVLAQQHPDFRWTCVGWSDIDKYACQMHNLIFPQFADKALGDITKIDWQQVKNNVGGARNRPLHLFLTLSGYIASRQADGFEGRFRHPLGIIVASSRCRGGIAPEVSAPGKCGSPGKREVYARFSEVA